jgi:hypothetical protein
MRDVVVEEAGDRLGHGVGGSDAVVESPRDPRSKQPVGAFGPGTAVGGAELLTGAVHQATLVAGEGLEVLVLAGPAFRYAAQTLPGLAGYVLGAATESPGALRGAAV